MKQSCLKLFLPALALAAAAWFLAPGLLDETAGLLVCSGCEDCALSIAELADVKEVSDAKLAYYQSIASLEKVPKTNALGDIKLWLPANRNCAHTAAVIRLLEQARKEIGSMIGRTDFPVRVRSPLLLLTGQDYEFNGLFLDIRFDRLLDEAVVYRGITRVAVFDKITCPGIPTSFPLWFDLGLSQYIPAMLGKATELFILGRTSACGAIEYRMLDQVSQKRHDFFPATLAVSLLFDKQHSGRDIQALLERIALGDHFPQAVQRAVGIPAECFVRKWKQKLAAGGRPGQPADSLQARLVAQAGRFFNNGNTALAALYMSQVNEKMKNDPDIAALWASILNKQAENLIVAGDHHEALAKLRFCLNMTERLPGDPAYAAARKQADTARRRLAEQLMATGREQSPSPEARPLRSKTSFAGRVAVSLSFAAISLFSAFLCGRFIIPAAASLFRISASPGSLITPCFLALLFCLIAKFISGTGVAWLQLRFLDEPFIDDRSAFLLYRLVSSFIIWMIGARLYRSNEGGSGDRVSLFFLSFLVFFTVSTAFGLSLHLLTFPSLGLGLVGVLPLWLLRATAEETFFRGGILSAARRNFHPGSAAVVSSIFWAVYSAALTASIARFFSSFCVGLLLCFLAGRTGGIFASTGARTAMIALNSLVIRTDGFDCTTSPLWLPALLTATCLLLRLSSANRKARTNRIGHLGF